MITLPDDMMAQVNSIALATDRTPDWIVKHALDLYMIDEGERMLAAINARSADGSSTLSIHEMQAVIDGDDLLPLVKAKVVELVRRHGGRFIAGWLTHRRKELPSGGVLVGMLDVPDDVADQAFREMERICTSFGLMDGVLLANEATPETVAREVEKGEVWE